jgi:signal transduction histidine kinase
MDRFRLLTELEGRPHVMRWVIGSLWVLGFLVLLADALGSAADVHLKVIRAVLMAGLGACMSALIWRFILQRQMSVGGRVALALASVTLAIAVHVLLDWCTGALLHLWFGDAPVRVTKVVVFNNPARTFLIGLFVQTNLAVLATLHAFFGIAATALRSSMETREREQLLSEARAATASAQLAMLRYQINPHFVFNTLNAIGSLVESGRNAQAGAMIEKLSDFLRSSLNSDGKTFSTLEEELTTVEAYLEIETVRFGERLHVQYDVARDIGHALVPSFILQPLIENAIKHAVAPAMHIVTLRVSARADADELRITIEDDGPGRLPDPAPRPRGAGVGLINVRERLSLLYGSAGQLATNPTDEGYTASLRMPLSLQSQLGMA